MKKDISCYNTNQKKTGKSVSISDGTDFRPRNAIREQREALHNDKRVGFPRRHNNR